jgi:microcystin-dependent protein
MAQNAAGNRTSPIGNSFARLTSGNAYIAGSPVPPLTPLALQTLPPIGGSAPHNNMMPYLTLSFCIALQGVFPPRS